MTGQTIITAVSHGIHYHLATAMRRNGLGFKLIGLTGPARSGKDSAARVLVNQYGFVRYGLADPLRKMLKSIDVHFSDGDKETPLPKFDNRTPRELMQSLGTEWMRDSVDKDGWLKMAQHEYMWLKHDPSSFGMVIPDVRFQNEADWVREHGVLIHISRPQINHKNKHESDKALLPKAGDFFICNDHTAAFLSKQINDYMNQRHEAPKNSVSR